MWRESLVPAEGCLIFGLSSAVDRSHEHDKVRKPCRKNLWYRGYIQGCSLTKICTNECKLRFLFWRRPNRVIEFACRLIQIQKSTNPERKTRTSKSQCFIGVCYTPVWFIKKRPGLILTNHKTGIAMQTKTVTKLLRHSYEKYLYRSLWLLWDDPN